MTKKIPICSLNKYAVNNIDYNVPINIKFTKDYNINHINFLILNKFESYNKKIPILKNKIRKIREELKASGLEKVDIYNYKRKINRYKNKIRVIEKEKEKKKYIEITKDILLLYNETKDNKVEIINDYLDIASKYIKLVIHKTEELNNYCLNCGKEVIFLGNTDDIQYCHNCKFQLPNNGNIKAYIRMSSGEEVKPINMNNFIKIINAFKCEDGFMLSKCEHKSLDRYFISQGNKDLRKIKSGKCKNNNISMMRKALHEIGKSNYYKNIYSICHQYFGWERNNITDIEGKILTIYEKIQIWFKNNPSKNRNSSLNNQWLLYKICEYLAPCRFNKSDFMIISSESSLIFHNDRWNKMKKESNIFS